MWMGMVGFAEKIREGQMESAVITQCGFVSMSRYKVIDTLGNHSRYASCLRL